MSYSLGVDLGTTFVAAAVAHASRVEMFTLGDRSVVTPAVVYVREDGTVVTGDAAGRRAVSNPDRVGREFKRRLGDPTPVMLGGAPHAVTALLANLLSDVVARVSATQGAAPDSLVLTHPANWGPFRRELFDEVPQIAGLATPRMVTEPEAAAAHYAATRQLEIGETVAVYDLGGGTFDATVLRRRTDDIEILGTPEGIERLGGVDFDEAILAHVNYASGGALSELDMSHPQTSVALARLRQDCVLAKEALSVDSETTIPVFLPNRHFDVRLTRAEFEGMIRAPVESTIGALLRTLRSADVVPEDLSAVLLVGGSSRIPLVATMVGEALGRPTAVDTHPKYAVALGAAALAVHRSGVAAPPVTIVPEQAPPLVVEQTPEPATTLLPAQQVAAAEVGTAQQAAAAQVGTAPEEVRPGPPRPRPAPAEPDAVAAHPVTPAPEAGVPRARTPRGPGPDLPVQDRVPREWAPRRNRAPQPTVTWHSGPPDGPSGPGGPGGPGAVPPRDGRRRRGPVVIAMAAVLVVVLGVAGWFAYDRLSAPAGPAVGPAAVVPPVEAAPPAAAASPPTVATSVPIPSLGKTIPAGTTPGYIAISPNGRLAYVANRNAGVVTVLDTSVDTVIATIPVQAGPPQYLAFAPDGKRVYVSIFNDARTVNVVGVLDTSTNSILSTIPVGTRPFALAVTPDGTRLYVPNHDSGTVSVIDTATSSPVRDIPVAKNPHWVGFSPDGTRAYTANHESGLITIIDTATESVIGEVGVQVSPHSVEVSPNRPLVANVNYDSDSVTVIDTDSRKVVATVPVGKKPQDLAWARDGRFLYVTAVDGDSLTVINTETWAVTATLPTGDAPTSLAVLPDGSRAYVTNLNGGTLTEVNLTG
ncbi:Hsp70 family protein [Pseudonocardia xishanensis]|uniref:YVTN family beta-propeller protein n=1 Tax=Pseudonocardia xishanensis TaxID=630995 RepID=A0ABP8RVG8_9PSEU